MIIDVNKENIQESVIQGSMDKTVLLYLFDPNSNNIATTSALEQAAKEYDLYITLAKADASDPIIQSICYQLQISALPAICVFNGGRPMIQRSFGDVQLLFRRVSREELAKTPEAQVVK